MGCGSSLDISQTLVLPVLKNVRSINFLRTVRRVLTSRRGYLAVSVNALSSLGNLGLSVAIARTSSIIELGQFAIAFSIYMLSAGIVRAAVVEPLLAHRPDRGMFRDSLQRASVLGIGAAVLVGIAGVVFTLPYLVVLAVAIHGCVVYEYVKTMSLASFKASNGLVQEAAWFIVSVVGAGLTLAGVTSAIVGFSVWAIGCALIGYTSAIILRLRLRPRWDNTLVSNKVAIAFGADFLIGSGSSQLALNAVSVVSGLAVVGALRAAGTILGPVTLVVTSARSLLIPYLSRTIASKSLSPLTGSVATTAVMTTVVLPVLVLLAIFPGWLGTLLLGSNWAFAQPVLPFLLIEMLFIVVTTVPFAGHRALLAAKNILMVRISMAVVRVAAIVLAAVNFGAVGAAIAMALTALLGAIVWWASYARLLKKQESTNE